MEITHAYNRILKGFVVASAICGVALVNVLKPDNLTTVTIVFGVFGFCAVPIVAVTFECAAECTFPGNLY